MKLCKLTSAALLGAAVMCGATVAKADGGAFSWTGFYAGLDVGERWSRASVNIPNYAPTAQHVQSGNGSAAGGFVGYNYQFNNVVLGIEGDISGVGGNSVALSGNGGTEQYQISESWRSSLRARAGLAFGHSLAYVTGGAAWLRYSTNYLPLAGVVQTTTAGGWIAGAGLEHAFLTKGNSALIGRIEYLYADHGTSNFVHNGPSSVAYKTQEVRVGLGVKF